MRRDAREPTDRGPELCVPIYGRRIWHMSDDRQVEGTVSPPFFGADLYSTTCESFPPAPPIHHSPIMGKDQPPDLKNERHDDDDK